MQKEPTMELLQNVLICITAQNTNFYIIMCSIEKHIINFMEEKRMGIINNFLKTVKQKTGEKYDAYKVQKAKDDAFNKEVADEAKLQMKDALVAAKVQKAVEKLKKGNVFERVSNNLSKEFQGMGGSQDKIRDAFSMGCKQEIKRDQHEYEYAPVKRKAKKKKPLVRRRVKAKVAAPRKVTPEDRIKRALGI